MSQLSKLWERIPPDVKIQLKELAIDVAIDVCTHLPIRTSLVNWGDKKTEIEFIVKAVCVQGKSFLETLRAQPAPINTNNP